MKKVLIFLTILFLTFIVFISKDFFQDSFEENDNPEIILEDLKKNKSGIYAFGFEECPWCEQLYPILDEVISEHNEKLRYVDTHNVNFTVDERTILKNYMIKNTEFDDVVVPFVVMVSENRSYQYHVGTLEGHDATKDKLTASQENELKKRLEDMIFKYQEK